MRECGPSSIGDALAEFCDELTIRGRSPQTVYSYRRKLAGRLDLAAPVQSLDSRLLRTILGAEVRKHAPNTAATFGGALASFTRFLAAMGYLPLDPMAGVPRPRHSEPEAKALRPAQVAMLWRAAEEVDGLASDPLTSLLVPRGGSAGGVLAEGELGFCTPASGTNRTRRQACARQSDNDSTTYRLVLLLLATTGLRRGELAGARWADIDWQARTLRVMGKGSKPRRVPLTDEVAGLLEMEMPPLSALGGLHADPARAIRSQSTILGLTGQQVYERFKRIARRAGLPAAHPHMLRHTYFTEFVRAGGSLSHAQTLGGWSSDRMLRTRYAKCAMEDAALAEARRVAAQQYPLRGR